MSDEGEAVQVAVRMRVFNKRELEAASPRVVRMERQLRGSNTYIKNPQTGEEKKFNFDYSFQSHSQTEPGIGDYATQDTVFKDLGQPVMEAALEGRNVCLFAYGQTGAGKSFSMLGKQEPGQEGIIPRTCCAIFDMVSANKNPLYEYAVDIQVVEIYCEQVNDLLADRKLWPPNGHKPHLTDKGYIVDTVRKPCFAYADIESAFQFADRNRSVASHALNPESSRAHTIYTINYERKLRNEAGGKVVETVTARLNLVDLAGSERCELAGTSGQMLKEGNAINLSLTALGQCIKALSEHKKPNFRDSNLTLLLKDSMTNGKVVMIAALSPAAICYEESLSTLRFAERIKQVKIKVSKNVTLDPVADMKRAMEAMREQMQREIDALRGTGGGGGGGGGAPDPEVAAMLQRQQEEAESMRIEYEKRLREMEETAQERLKRAEEIAQMQQHALGGASLKKKEDVSDPHLLNLHEDPRLAETLVYPLKEGITVIGRTNKEAPPDLEFNGMGITKNHAKLEYSGGRVFLTPGHRSRTLINGKPTDTTVELKHNTRVWLGNNYAFRFAFPGKEADGEKFEEPPDYAFAESEIAENSSLEIASHATTLPSGLSKRLSEALKKVEQANIITVDLGKKLEFEAKMFKNRITGETEVAVKVVGNQGEMHWPWEKFEQRLVSYAKEWETWQRAEESNQMYHEKPPSEDPFMDLEPQLVGEADVWLQSLANMMDFRCSAPVLSVIGKAEGRVNVSLIPCDSKGREGPWDEDDPNDPFVDDPSELLGRSVTFCVHIDDIVFDSHGMSTCRYNHTWLRYKINPQDPEEEWHCTTAVPNATFNPKFNHKSFHVYQVDQHVLNMFSKGRMLVQAWGTLSDVAVTENTEEGELAERRRILAELEKQIEERKQTLSSLR
eukprot:TRINITY_DN68692_c0_g1_i1.p1 TRINITY_DN68692_c0_g1~~TRINITY_DN68692_c0_g1_i1.p1  ORF type:complete len:899 (+),score=165.89 TRINITY_DN68692_c0_g1_i1:50-2746(+)